MSPGVARQFDVWISLVVGLLATLYGFRVIGPASGRDDAQEQRYQRFAKLARWLGPVILRIGIIRILAGR
jgi:hypothetical protein